VDVVRPTSVRGVTNQVFKKPQVEFFVILQD
jgi:hypothetical protein